MGKFVDQHWIRRIYLAYSVGDYIKITINLSQDTEMLSSIKYLLRKMMRDSPLMNAESLAH